ncbi:MAG: hypothetical protein SO054_09480 [Ruminococcus callidus]|nr:hypothetical protein [Ruminococcus callidus]
MLKQLQKHRITSRQCMREGLYGMPIGAGNCKKPANNFSTAFPESNSIFSATPHKARLTALCGVAFQVKGEIYKNGFPRI